MSSSPRAPLLSFLSALLLYVLHHVFNVVAVAVIPMLLALGRASPRFGALGWLALLTSPVAFVAPVHRIAHAVLDRFDSGARTPDTSPGVTSLWAGLFAWFAMAFSSLASGLLLLAIFPPPVNEGAFAVLLQVLEDAKLALGTHAVLWVAIATLLYYVERVVLRGSR